MDLELRHLQLVVAIAETGSVTRAGERLFLTQSALSHQLRDIEGRLSARLFHRVGKRMVPTSAGEAMLRSARDVIDLVVRTEDNVRRASSNGHGVLRLATECSTCYHWLPGILKEYRRAHPAIDIQIEVAETSHPLAALVQGRLDLAIVSSRIGDRRLVTYPLFEDDMVVIVAPDHPLAAKPFVRLQDFASETLLLYPPKEDSTLCNEILRPAGIAPAAIQAVPLTEGIIELVKAGLGVAVLAEWAVAPYVRAGSLRALPLTRRGYHRRWSAAVLRDMAAAPYVKDFVALLAKLSPVSDERPRKLGLLAFDRPKRRRRVEKPS
jgi:LysR family transcriptional regulator, regulator for metE and metH